MQWAEAADKLREMVRPFTLRDLALVRRLSEQGVSMHAESALADDLHPLRDALASMVVSGNSPTFIFRSEERKETGFIQLRLEDDRHHAHILYLSPAIDIDSAARSTPSDGSSAWLSLLDQAVAEAGSHGVHSLVAEVDEQGPELPVLRQAGFAVYTRQDIWLLDEQNSRVNGSDSAGRLLPYLSSDDWDIQILYANTVPRLVQLVEPLPPLMTRDGWVLRDDDNELAAFINVHRGSTATWLRSFIHPNAEADAIDIVKGLLKIELERDNKPIYCCVRRYEGLLPAALERMGFQIWGSQAVLVKHTVHHLRRKQPELVVNLENSGMPATSPFVRPYPLQEDQSDVLHYREGEIEQDTLKKAFANQ